MAYNIALVSYNYRLAGKALVDMAIENLAQMDSLNTRKRTLTLKDGTVIFAVKPYAAFCRDGALTNVSLLVVEMSFVHLTTGMT